MKIVFKLLLAVTGLLFAVMIGFEWCIGINSTESLPHTIYLLQKNKIPKRGDIVSFQKDTQGVLSTETQFIKQIIGIAGDTVNYEKDKVFLNHQYVGQLKTKSKEGKTLFAGYEGEIPSGFLFVYTPHPDSFDSRYAQIGLIHESEIIAVAYPLW